MHARQLQKETSDLINEICEVHENRYLDLFCESCKSYMCYLCYVESHKEHNIIDSKTYKEKRKKKLKDNIFDINKKITEYENKMIIFKDVMTEFISETDRINNEIIKKSLELQNMIEKHKLQLLQKLLDIKMENVRMNALIFEELEAKLINLKKCFTDNEELINQVSKVNQITEYEDLNIRTTELCTEKMPSIDTIFNYKFCENSMTIKYGQNLIGNIVSCNKKKTLPRNLNGANINIRYPLNYKLTLFICILFCYGKYFQINDSRIETRLTLKDFKFTRDIYKICRSPNSINLDYDDCLQERRIFQARKLFKDIKENTRLIISSDVVNLSYFLLEDLRKIAHEIDVLFFMIYVNIKYNGGNIIKDNGFYSSDGSKYYSISRMDDVLNKLIKNACYFSIKNRLEILHLIYNFKDINEKIRNYRREMN